MRTLVVDDEQVFLQLITKLLEAKGLKDVHTASSYPEILKAMDAPGYQPYDLMILDCVTPEMDVIGFLHGLERRNYKGKVVLITGSSLEVLKSREWHAKIKNLNLVGAIQKSSLDKGIDAMLQKIRSE